MARSVRIDTKREVSFNGDIRAWDNRDTILDKYKYRKVNMRAIHDTRAQFRSNYLSARTVKQSYEDRLSSLKKKPYNI